MKKLMKPLLACAAVFTVLAVSATLALSVLTLRRVEAMNGKAPKVVASEPAGEPAAPSESPREDGAVIAESYTVRSTKAVSDAYLTGDSSALSEEEKETLSLASEVLKGIVKDNMTPYDKECAVFDWMLGNIEIDDGGLTLIQDDPDAVSAPNGVLKNKKAVCVGYATTFRLMMQMLDIPCHVVPSSALGHTWNLVQLGENWYHVDVYSAEQERDGHYYLNIPDEMMAQEWERAAFPAAASYEFCWLYKNAAESEDIYTLPAQIKRQADTHTNLLSLLFPVTSQDDKNTAEALLARVSERLMYSDDYSGSVSLCTFNAAEVDGKLFVCVNIIYYDDSDGGGQSTGNLDEERINNAVVNVFGEEEISTEPPTEAETEAPTEVWSEPATGYVMQTQPYTEGGYYADGQAPMAGDVY